ncbi:hypothetical protein [Streptomyces malaysiensis]|uniref:hypothetical protein n=1 Tax=Streptomyces malaysiensis TaxID=92644 RepID=UPI000853DA5C|nr:hypothetical protein [Streptomyces sp. SPMA113]
MTASAFNASADAPVRRRLNVHTGLATAVWALVHGLAFLHLDAKFDTSTPEVVADRVRAAVHAHLGVTARRCRNTRNGESR